jgi:hypothetical protein
MPMNMAEDCEVMLWMLLVSFDCLRRIPVSVEFRRVGFMQLHMMGSETQYVIQNIPSIRLYGMLIANA